MKRILFFMATLLLSAGAFAQNVNSNKRVYGDVNGDGVVNINDVVAVVNIILTPEYFYLGTTQPTVNNYKSLLGVETSYSSIDNAVGTVVPIAAGETLYMMCPVSWMDGKGVELEDISGNTINFMEEKDESTISGYVIYKTQVWNDATELTLKTKKYYYFAGKYPANQQSFCLNWSSFDEDAFLAWDSKQAANSINEIKEILSANGGVVSMNSNKECIYIVAPTEIIDQISGIRMPVGYLMIERFDGTNYSMLLGDEVYTTRMTIEFK